MQVLIIYPDWGWFPLEYRKRLPVLGPLSVAACFRHYDAEVRYIDDRIETFEYSNKYDAVLISFMTNQLKRAREIALEFRKRHVPVIAGGVHPSVAPEESLEFADSVVIGEAEGSYQKWVPDLMKGRLQKYYTCEEDVDLSIIEKPPRHLNKGKNYLPIDFVQTSRGCPVGCDFCSVPQLTGRRMRHRSVEMLIEEMEELKPYLFFVDDNLSLARRYAEKLFREMSGLGRTWTGLASIKVADNPEFVELMARSGCWLLYVEMGPWLNAELCGAVKTNEVQKKFKKWIRIFKNSGIKLIGSFVFGYDHDDETIFHRVVEFAQNSGLEEAEFVISTPYPGTRLYSKLKEENRILTHDWARYTAAEAVFRPRKMSPEQLEKGWRSAWKLFYPQDKIIGKNDDFIIDTLAAFPSETPERTIY